MKEDLANGKELRNEFLFCFKQISLAYYNKYGNR